MKRREVDVDSLVQHPLHEELYGSQRDDEWKELKDTMEEFGQLADIVVAADGRTIISGSRRWLAAKALGWPRVRVAIDEDAVSDDDVREKLLLWNFYRTRTTEIRAREREARARWLRAKIAAGEMPPVPVSVLSAKQSGMSQPTADKAAAVVKEADAKKAAGKIEEANALLATLNERGASAAFAMTEAGKAAAAKKADKREPISRSEKERLATAIAELKKSPVSTPCRQTLTKMQDVLSTWPLTQPKDKAGNDVPRPVVAAFSESVFDAAKALRALCREVKAVRGKAGAWLESEAVVEHLELAAKGLDDARPAVVCPDCHGHGCDNCRNSGFYPAWAWNDRQAGRDDA